MFPMFIRESVWSILRFLNVGGLLLQVHPKSYLARRGWFRSFRSKRSVDGNGAPIPWWSYAVIDFVGERLREDFNVLEFGSGGSTIWLASRTRHVVSIENDPAWAKIVRSIVPSNVSLVELDPPGSLTSEHLPTELRAFDVMIIDALADRIDCCKAGLPFLNDRGVVIWDNTDGSDWPEINSMMIERGFREISFSGIAPQEVALDRTTIFYRPENVFGI